MHFSKSSSIYFGIFLLIFLLFWEIQAVLERKTSKNDSTTNLRKKNIAEIGARGKPFKRSGLNIPEIKLRKQRKQPKTINESPAQANELKGKELKILNKKQFHTSGSKGEVSSSINTTSNSGSVFCRKCKKNSAYYGGQFCVKCLKEAKISSVDADDSEDTDDNAEDMSTIDGNAEDYIMEYNDGSDMHPIANVPSSSSGPCSSQEQPYVDHFGKIWSFLAYCDSEEQRIQILRQNELIRPRSRNGRIYYYCRHSEKYTRMLLNKKERRNKTSRNPKKETCKNSTKEANHNSTNTNCSLRGIYIEKQRRIYTHGEHNHPMEPLVEGNIFIDQYGKRWRISKTECPPEELPQLYSKYGLTFSTKIRSNIYASCKEKKHKCPMKGLYYGSRETFYTNGKHNHPQKKEGSTYNDEKQEKIEPRSRERSQSSWKNGSRNLSNSSTDDASLPAYQLEPSVTWKIKQPRRQSSLLQHQQHFSTIQSSIPSSTSSKIASHDFLAGQSSIQSPLRSIGSNDSGSVDLGNKARHDNAEDDSVEDDDDLAIHTNKS